MSNESVRLSVRVSVSIRFRCNHILLTSSRSRSRILTPLAAVVAMTSQLQKSRSDNSSGGGAEHSAESAESASVAEKPR